VLDRVIERDELRVNPGGHFLDDRGQLVDPAQDDAAQKGVVVVEAAGQRLDQCVVFSRSFCLARPARISGSCSPSMRACIMARPDTPRMSVATTDSFTQASCGVFSSSVKGWVLTRSRAIPYGTAVLRLVWRKRRWRCTEVVCARGSFIEASPAVPTRARLTVRLRAERAHAVAEQHRCVAETAAHYQVGWATTRSSPTSPSPWPHRHRR